MSDKKVYSDRQKKILVEIGKKFRRKIHKEMITKIVSTMSLCLLLIYAAFKILNYNKNMLVFLIVILIIGTIIGILNLVQYTKKMVALKNSNDMTIGLHYKHKEPSIIGNSKLILSNQGYPLLILAISTSIIFGIFFLAYLDNTEEITWLIGTIVSSSITLFCLVWFLVHKFYIYRQNLKKEKFDFELNDYEVNEIDISTNQINRESVNNLNVFIVIKPSKKLIYLMCFFAVLFTILSILLYFHFEDITSKIVSVSIMGTFAFLSILGIISGYIEKEILTDLMFEKHRLFKTTVIPLSDIRMIQYLLNTIKIIKKEDNNHKWVVCSNRDISALLEGFEKAGIFIEPLT